MADTPPSIVIEEIVGGMQATLSDANGDLPMGRRYEVAAFESGVDVEIAEDGIYNPGSDRVVYPVMQPKYPPMQLRGAFHDQFGGAGYARRQRDLFVKLGQRSNPLRITWANDEYQGILHRARFGEQSQADITYDVTFLIAVPPAGTGSKRSQPQQTLDTSDVIAYLRAQAQASRAKMEALAIAATVNSALASRYDQLDASLQVAAVAATSFTAATLGTPHAVLAASQRVQAACTGAGQQAVALAEATDMRADAACPAPTAENSRQWWGYTLETQGLALQLQDGLRTCAQIALSAVRKTTRLYRVQDGDTLESIAAAQLGSAARALDLGVPPAALVPGRYVRIPEAA